MLHLGGYNSMKVNILRAKETRINKKMMCVCGL